MQQQNALWYYVEDNLQTHIQSQNQELAKCTQGKAERLSSSQFQVSIVPHLFSPFLHNISTESTKVGFNSGNQILCVCGQS